MLKIKNFIAVLISVLLLCCVAFGFSACKKDEKNTSSETQTYKTWEEMTPEERSEAESKLQNDDNVVEDPFGDDSGSSSGSSKSGSSKSGSSNSGSSKSSGGSDSGSNKNSTTVANSDTQIESGDSGDDEDYNSGEWTGWY